MMGLSWQYKRYNYKGKNMKIKSVVLLLFVLILTLPLSLQAASTNSSYPWQIKKVSLLCEVFPASNTISVDGSINFCKIMKADDCLNFAFSPKNIRFSDEKGRQVNFESDPDGNIWIKPAFSLGNHTLHFCFYAKLPVKSKELFGLLLNKDFVDIEGIIPWFPIFPKIMGSQENATERPWFHAEIGVTAPEGITLYASGKKIGEKHFRGKVTRYFRTTSPVWGGLSIRGGRYQDITGTADKLRFNILVPSDLLFKQAKAWKTCVQKTLEFYLDRYGFFPYPELTIFNRPWSTSTKGWGCEHGSLLLDGKENFTISPNEISPQNFVAHEIYHQYVGGIVRTHMPQCGMLVLEGVTNFVSTLCARDVYGEKAFQEIVSGYIYGLKTIPPQEDTPLLQVDSRHPHLACYSYDKMPLFLLEMHRLIGDSRMRDIEKTFIQRFRFGRQASFKDFIDILQEKTSNIRGAKELCDKWLAQKGIPDISILDKPKSKK